jgi:hypothetical protein
VSSIPVKTPSETLVSRTQPALYDGVYRNPGYGDITLCSSSSATKSCAQVLVDFSVFENTKAVIKGLPRLYASWTRLWSTHARMVPSAQNASWEFTATSLYPRGFGRDGTAFQTPVGMVVGEFGVERGGQVVGFGLFGLINKSPDMEEAERGKSVKERADVWFDKVLAR